MLISHRYRFIYTKTLKTASTSVESFFERLCMHDGEWSPTHARDEYESSTGIIGFRGAAVPLGTKWWNHMPAMEIKEKIGEEIWNSYFKFCCIRNPFEKCISAFAHFGNLHQTIIDSIPEDVLEQSLSSEQLRFLSFLINEIPVDRDKYVINGHICMNDFIKYERLLLDIKRISRIIGFQFDHDNIPNYKSLIRMPDQTVENLYTVSSRKIVLEKFAYEFSQFGYQQGN